MLCYVLACKECIMCQLYNNELEFPSLGTDVISWEKDDCAHVCLCFCLPVKYCWHCHLLYGVVILCFSCKIWFVNVFTTLWPITNVSFVLFTAVKVFFFYLDILSHPDLMMNEISLGYFNSICVIFVLDFVKHKLWILFGSRYRTSV